MLKKVPKTNILVAQYNIGLKWFGTLLPDHFKHSVGKGVIFFFFETQGSGCDGLFWYIELAELEMEVKLKITPLRVTFDKKAFHEDAAKVISK